MIITKTCNTCEHYPNDKHCIGCEWDKSRGENSKWELKENPIVIERAVLEQIRNEIAELKSNKFYTEEVRNGLRMALDVIDNYRG